MDRERTEGRQGEYRSGLRSTGEAPGGQGEEGRTGGTSGGPRSTGRGQREDRESTVETRGRGGGPVVDRGGLREDWGYISI